MSKQMLVMNLACPHCGVGLTRNGRVHLDGQVRGSAQDGAIHLSAVFGDYSVESDLAVRDGDIVEYRCSECDASLMLPLACKLCGAPMASLNMAKEGYLEFCSRRGCKAHALGGVGDVDDMMGMMNRMFETPYD